MPRTIEDTDVAIGMTFEELEALVDALRAHSRKLAMFQEECGFLLPNDRKTADHLKTLLMRIASKIGDELCKDKQRVAADSLQ